MLTRFDACPAGRQSEFGKADIGGDTSFLRQIVVAQSLMRQPGAHGGNPSHSSGIAECTT
jgi:hypothetical protein